MTSTAQRTGAQTAKPAIEDVLALSPLQQGLFSMATLAGAAAPDGSGESAPDPYVIAMAADVTGALDVELLRRCADALFVRHPNLRASFVHGNLSRPVQVIPSQVDVPWRIVTARPEDLADVVAAERRRRFDVSRGPLVRFLLVETASNNWHLVVLAHHLVIDGWSLPLFITELLALYRNGGDVSALPPAPRPYRDYIGWLGARDTEVTRALWRQHLADIDGPTLLTPALAAAAPAPGLPRTTELRLPADRTTALAEAARGYGVTLNAIVQFAWATILSALTDRGDVVFGVTVSGRPEQLSGVETMIGLFVNTVPLRVRLHPAAGVGEQCIGLQRSAAELREHSYLGHAELRALAGVGELFDTLLVYENFPPGGLVGSTGFEAGGATFIPSALESLSHFPVTIAAHLTGGELTVLVEVLDGALGQMTPEDLGQRVLEVSQRIIAGWERPLRDLSVLLPGEHDTAPAGETARTTTDVSITAQLRQVAQKVPDAPALSWDGGQFDYRELVAEVDALAARLHHRGVRTESPVAICLPRGPQYVLAMLAVLEAGGLIVPLDPELPAERIEDICAQVAAAHGPPLVIDQTLLDTTESAVGLQHSMPDRHPGQAAYAVFTSGTTGRPKGVLGTHQAVLAYAADHIDRVLRPAQQRLGRPLRVAHAWSFTFDAAWQPLVALLDGHCVHIIGDDAQRDAEALVATIDRFQIDLIDTTPSMFTQLYHAGLLTEVPLPVLAMGGEAVKSSTWQRIREHCAATGMSAFNCYGPTETTVEAVVAALTDHHSPSIGSPTAGTEALVLDSWLRPVPDGAAGELYLAGAQLTRGYLGRPGETAARFVAHPHRPGHRMYRTGDVVRRRADGGFEFLGRSDDQVKVRGFRVEPGEIAATLSTHAGVRGAHVLVQRTPRGPRLVAYAAVGAEAAPAPQIAELREWLMAKLPRYLVPHHIVVLPELPLTGHGKIDENALAATTVDTMPAVTAQTPTEAELAGLLAEVLALPDADAVDVSADFLELGLDSIVALSFVQLARRRGMPMRARLLRDCLTIRDLAAVVDGEAEPHPAGAAEAGEHGPIPVLANVHWLYEWGQARRLAQTEAIRLPDGATAEGLQAMLDALVAGHEVLRCRLDRASMTLVPDAPPVHLAQVDIGDHDLNAAVVQHTAAAVESLDPEAGRLLAATWLRAGTGSGVLVLTAHVLALDPASWRIALGELDASWHALAAGREPAAVREDTDYRSWSAALHQRAKTLDTVDFWAGQLRGPDPALGARRIDRDRDRAADLVLSFCTADAALTARLLTAGTPVTDQLAIAAARMVTAWRARRGQDTPTPLLALETHGRADALVAGGDTGDTLGLFSAIYPLRVDPAAQQLPIDPLTGIDYPLLRYLRDDTKERLRVHPEPQVLLNYLGRIHSGAGAGALLPERMLLLGVSAMPEPDLAVRHEITLAAAVVDGPDGRPALATQWRTVPTILTAEDVETLQELWLDALREVTQ